MVDAFMASLPLFVLLVGLPIMMKPAVKVAPWAWLVTIIIAIIYFDFPAKLTLLAALQGVIVGVVSIMYIPFSAMVVYNVLKETGWMDRMQGAMAVLTLDRRAQALLIGFGFGAFLEGICGFGIPVAIPASILVGLGYAPMLAALVCLVANTGPVPFGSLGIPTETLAWASQLDAMKLSQMTGRLMPPLAFLMAFATVYVMAGWRGVKSSLPLIFITGSSFAVVEYLTANYIGATLVDILASIVCLTAVTAYLSYYRDEEIWLLPGETVSAGPPLDGMNFRMLFVSWLPYILLAILIIGVNLPQTKPFFAGQVPGSEFLVIKAEVYSPNKIYTFPWLQSPGTIMLIAGFIAFKFMGIRFAIVQEQFFRTFRQMIPPFIAVGCILSISEVMNLALPIVDARTRDVIWSSSGGAEQPSMVAVMAKSMVKTVDRYLYPFISPLVGAFGVFLTGSNTSANALLGNLQKFTAHGLELSDILMASAGSAGSTAGKMISPQSIVIAAAAVGLLGKEGLIMRRTIKYTIPYILLLGLMTWLYAFVFPDLVP